MAHSILESANLLKGESQPPSGEIQVSRCMLVVGLCIGEHIPALDIIHKKECNELAVRVYECQMLTMNFNAFCNHMLKTQPGRL